MWLLLSPMLVVFFISGLAETNRPPFDLPEGESELVGGFNTEYSAMTFAMFMLGEYANMFMICALTTMLFLGGWLPLFGIQFLSFIPGVIWFVGKMCAVMFLFLWVRATLPRFRYDQLMRLGWKVFLPFSLAWVMVIAGVLLATGTLPAPQ
jgi:NADH-quinone oxidoreductase subunit H